jgi:hypothetical protein
LLLTPRSEKARVFNIMGRTIPTKAKIVILAVIVAVAASLGTWAYVGNLPSHKVDLVTNAQHQTTQVSYQGEQGANALALLKKHANVTTKHYSFGDMVTSIDGTSGNGPKYWTFYINGKEANVGAGSYTTKSSDHLAWKLQ